jgi:hypothetical protein
MGIHVRIFWRKSVAVLSSMLLIPSLAPSAVHDQQPSAAEEPAPTIPNDQLDSLVAPIALYPDPLLAQALAASTYPLELMQLKQWLDKHKDLKDKALTEAVQKQPWDASVQAMAALPDAVQRLTEDIGWTTDLGNAFLAQQSDVMDAVQRMRAKAKDTGNLKSNEQMKVETKVIENKSVVVIEQSNPQVVYVPSYNPTVIYGAPAYPYPPISYPPPGYYAAGMAISFGVGMAIGAAWGGGGWGYNSNWGGNNNININRNNTFVNNSNRQNVSGNRTGNSWQHNAQHRGGAPYGNKSTANKFGGTARGDSMSSRQANARQNQSQSSGRGQQARSTDRGAGSQSAGAGNRAAGDGARGNRSGGDRVGDRSVSSGGGSRGGSAFGGGSGGMSGSSARASSSRGSSSAGGGGGRSRGGGGGRRR